jgi:hypothetical protein
VGPSAELPPEQVPTAAIEISVPIVLNWKDMGIVLWVECEGEAYLNESWVCGVHLKRQTTWRIEKTKRFEKSVYPELWIAKEWPAIPIGSETSGIQNWVFDSTKTLPLEAVIKKLGS